MTYPIPAQTDLVLDENALHLVSLGGAGEIGMNLTLYAWRGKWLMVDLGISFADETTPGLEVILPDPRFIEERKADLVGLVLTHGHEDHLGAIRHLWPRLECPIFCTPFTAAVLRNKLGEMGPEAAARVPVNVIPTRGAFAVGPFECEYIGVTHSILEPQSLAIHTDVGTVIHTGDWKLDPEPLIGDTADEARFRALGDQGVLALICDSTNAQVEGSSGSEADVRRELIELLPKIETRIAVCCFATNVVRLESIAAAARAAGRDTALVGRSLWRMNEAARSVGYLKDTPPFLSESDVGYIPRDKLVMICTGSQGEPRSALSRIAAEDHPNVSLDPGDVVIFSSREIPGNEKAVARVQNRLTARGVEVITSDDAPVHVSGHPARDELRRMYEWVRPAVSVAVHGEPRHQHAHAQLAEELGVPVRLTPVNGELMRLGPGPAAIIAHVPVGRLAIDGKKTISLDSDPMRERRKMIHSGAAVVTVVLDRDGYLVTAPRITALGFVDGDLDHDALLDAADAVREAIGELTPASRADDGLVTQIVRVAVRRGFSASHGKKPVTEVHVIRV